MTTIRPYSGTAAELSEFVLSVWREYTGKMAFPLWSAEYFEWQLNLSSGNREHLLAAWVDDELAGVLIGLRAPFRLGRTRHSGVISSWLSIRPEFRGKGLVTELKAEQDRRMAAEGHGLVLSYRYYGSTHSLSKRPREAELTSGKWDSRRVGFWVRILDPARAAAWYVSPMQQRLTRLAAPLTLPPRRVGKQHVVREFRAGDAGEALAVVKAASQEFEFTLEWTEETLARHCSGFGRCLVVEEEGRVAGLIAWHVLRFQGATEESIGIIDIVAIEGLSQPGQRALLNAVLGDLKENGAVIALKLRTGDVPVVNMLLAGFFPWFSDSFETLHAVDGALPRVLGGPHHVLWR